MRSNGGNALDRRQSVPRASAPVLSIAIPTYRRSGYLRQALSSVASEVAAGDDLVEVVVSDNASEDDTAQAVQAFSGLRVRYHRNGHNLGLAENVLLACERCSGAYVFLLCDDDLISPGALKAVLTGIAEHPQLGIITGPVALFSDKGDAADEGRLRFRSVAGRDMMLPAGAQAFETTFLRAASVSGLVIRRELLDTDGARRHSAAMYPQMYLVGSAARRSDALYLTTPVVRIRMNEVRHWQYSHDHMAAGVLAILSDLTSGQPWGAEIRRRLVRRRIRASFASLLAGRGRSFKAFLATTRALAAIPEYRGSLLFWSIVFAVAVFGVSGAKRLARMSRMAPPDEFGMQQHASQ